MVERDGKDTRMCSEIEVPGIDSDEPNSSSNRWERSSEHDPEEV